MEKKVITFFINLVVLLPTVVFANGIGSPGCLGLLDTIESLLGVALMGVGVGVVVVLKRPK